MKKIILTALIFTGISTTAFATTYEPLYNCQTWHSIIPGKVWEESSCIAWGNPNSKTYTECVEDVKSHNIASLKEFNAGKCTKTGYIRAQKTLGDCTCRIDFNPKTNKLSGYGSGISKATKEGSIFKTTDNGCKMELAKELDKKYPNLNAAAQFIKPQTTTLKTFNINSTKINNTTFVPQYSCKVNNTYFNFDPSDKPVRILEIPEEFDKLYQEDIARYNKGVNAVNAGKCKQNHTKAELTLSKYKCAIFYNNDGKINGYTTQGMKSGENECFTQLFKAAKQKVPHLYGESKWAKYGIPQTQKQNNPTVKVNMPAAPKY